MFGEKRPGCIISVFSVRAGLFLPLADNYLPVHIIVAHHMDTCRTES